MAIKIATAFPPKADNKSKACEGDPRRISEAGRGKGRGGRGYGRRDGKCRGRCGQGDGGGGRGGNGSATFNGVDMSNHTYNFLDSEMSKMGHDERMSIFERRNRYKGRNKYGRGRQGHGDRKQNYQQRLYGQGDQSDRRVRQTAANRTPEEGTATINAQTAIVPYDPSTAAQKKLQASRARPT